MKTRRRGGANSEANDEFNPTFGSVILNVRQKYSLAMTIRHGAIRMGLADNPYQSPLSEPDIDAKQPIRPNLAWEMKQALFLVVGTFVGGFVGNPVGTIVARMLRLIPGPFLQITDLFEIRHAFGLGVLVIGSFLGAWVGMRAASLGRR